MDLIYTIGHSTHTLQKLTALLAAHGVTGVADVRSQPYSQFNPQFNKESLSVHLKSTGIAYVFLGRELGARSQDQACYVDDKVEYDLLARTPLFREGLERLVRGAAAHRIALLCAEKDPLTCHRTILVCRHLVSRGLGVRHILDDGRIEEHDAAMDRLLSEESLGADDLFHSRDDLIAEAYVRRGRRIAYSAKPKSSEAIGRGVDG